RDDVERDGVDRKIAPGEVVDQTAGADARQRAGLTIPFASRSGDVDVRKGFRGHFVRQKLRVRAHAAVDALGDPARERGAALFESEIEVDYGAAEEEVADGAADEKGAQIFLRGHFLDQIERAALRSGEGFEADHGLRSSI